MHEQTQQYMQQPAPQPGKQDWPSVMALVMSLLGLVPLELLFLLFTELGHYSPIQLLFYPVILIGAAASLLALLFARIARQRWRANQISHAARRLYRTGAIVGLIGIIVNTLLILSIAWTLFALLHYRL